MSPEIDDDLRRLVTEVAESVDPADRLSAIRAAGQARHGRAWLVPLAAAAAVVTVLGAVALGLARPGDDGTTPIAPDPSVEVATRVVPAYYVGETPRGPRLFREFHRRPIAELDAGGLSELTTAPEDPDYRTLWPENSFAGIGEPADGVVEIVLGDASLTARPAAMTEREAQLAVEQVVYTVQANFGDRLAVQFTLDGNPVNEVYGVPTSEPLINAPLLETLSLLNISDPGEGTQVSDEVLRVTGVANVFEGNVVLELRRGDEVVVGPRPFIADGAYGERLYPFVGTLPIAGLEPGTYTVRAWSEDASGLQEPLEDTKTVEIR